jgi:hypothetical protein
MSINNRRCRDWERFNIAAIEKTGKHYANRSDFDRT